MRWANRLIAIPDPGQPADAQSGIWRVYPLPAGPNGRDTLAPHYETTAIAALTAGDSALDRDPIERSPEVDRKPFVEEQAEHALEGATAKAGRALRLASQTRRSSLRRSSPCSSAPTTSFAWPSAGATTACSLQPERQAGSPTVGAAHPGFNLPDVEELVC